MSMEKLVNRIEEELLQDQESLYEVLIQDKPDKHLISFYEGSASSLRTVLLIIEHEYL